MYCDARSIYVLKTMEFLDFGEIFWDAKRAILCIRRTKLTTITELLCKWKDCF